MAALAYPLLEAAYDLQHCAYLLANLHEELKPLRVQVHSPLRWDERYASYLQRAGFLDIAVQVVAGLPPMDGPLWTAMVDWWCLETHNFHLPCGEVTVTMQVVAMILDLPLEGHPSENWRDMVEVHIGIRPPKPEEGDNLKKTSSVSSAWLRAYLQQCGPLERRYKSYTNEFDVVTQNQRQAVVRSTTPMILYYFVEMHMPHRVMRQFGRIQTCPPMELSTSQALHRIDHKKRYKENDWRVNMLSTCFGGRTGPNRDYIRLYCASTRNKVKPSWSIEPIEDAPFDSSDDVLDEYDTMTRLGT
uniref:Aminotransferase-like plant mobile domain-containing protein n=1 Tax=Setaria italica TaxID=4555 RepID=K4AL80_SETIT